jgi:hypothetical protein
MSKLQASPDKGRFGGVSLMHELQHCQLGCIKNNQGDGENDAGRLFDFPSNLRNTLRLLANSEKLKLWHGLCF